MYNITQPKQDSNKMVIGIDYSSESGKLGRHTLSFRTGAMKDRKKAANKRACRGRSVKGEW